MGRGRRIDSLFWNFSFFFCCCCWEYCGDLCEELVLVGSALYGVCSLDDL